MVKEKESRRVAVAEYWRRCGASNGEDVVFLARGEYSLNFRAGDWVIRLITGSQMGYDLAEQAGYEYAALRAIEPSRVTPAPRFVDPKPDALDYPVLVERFLPGRPLNYAHDLAGAARCIAAIHALGVPADGHGLQVHAAPAEEILTESRGWAANYLAWPAGDRETQACLEKAFPRIERLLDRRDLFARDDLAIVNYDLNTHNFVVDGGGAVRLLDWEKARIAPRSEDLGHFLLPTTTLWRDETAKRLTDEEEQLFIDTYIEHAGIVDRQRFVEQLRAMRILIALRAVTWCSWALHAEATGTKTISNPETLAKARRYLAPDFLADLLDV